MVNQILFVHLTLKVNAFSCIVEYWGVYQILWNSVSISRYLLYLFGFSSLCCVPQAILWASGRWWGGGENPVTADESGERQDKQQQWRQLCPDRGYTEVTKRGGSEIRSKGGSKEGVEWIKGLKREGREGCGGWNPFESTLSWDQWQRNDEPSTLWCHYLSVFDWQVKLEDAMAARENPMINDIRKNERGGKPNCYTSVPSSRSARRVVLQCVFCFHLLPG